jgi:CRISPR/Cas system CSM-associated protein Csm3 (group 7 of RAMP superfamily)
MSIGSGKEDETDGDIVLNSKNEPYIPGTSLAGIYRSLFDETKQKKFFGYIKKAGEKAENDKKQEPAHLQSSIVVYDGKCTNYKKGDVSKRDSVKLDEYKVAETGAKFDFQIAETGLEFISYIELDKNHTAEMEKAVENTIIPALNSSKIALGHKTTRGYGKVSATCQKKEFDLSAELDNWLDFDMFEDKDWEHAKDIGIAKNDLDFEIIKIPLIQTGAVSIRRYVTEAAKKKGDSVPDYEQLTLKDDSPVIPGTSWAGAFRHRIQSYGIDEQKIDNLFGYVNISKKESKKSKIYFSETDLSNLSDGKFKQITRNSIDRFSAGTKEGALFTEKTYYNGKTTLEIRLDKDADSIMKKLVYSCVLDLCLGYLAVGGLTAIGHGMFELQRDEKITVDGKEFDIEKWEGTINA